MAAMREPAGAGDGRASKPEDLDLIIVGTISADMPLPSCAAFVQAKLGAGNAAAFDVAAACAGSLYAMSIADRFIVVGQLQARPGGGGRAADPR